MKHLNKHLYAAISFIFLALFAMPVSAGKLAEESASHSEARLYLERTALRPGSNWIAFEVTPIEGWHTYWKNPGDSGAAPIFEWLLPDGLTAGEALFQAPHKIPVAHLMNYGYSGSSVILVPLQLDEQNPGGNMNLQLVAEWLVCEIECVPQYAEWNFALAIDPEAPIDETSASLFASARAKMPDHSFWSATMQVGSSSAELQIFMTAEEAEEVTDAYFFPEQEGIVTYAAAQPVGRNADGLYLRLPRESGGPVPAIGKGLLRLSFGASGEQAFRLDPMFTVQEESAFSKNGSEAVSANSGPAASIPVWQAALYALLGGLILNLMPCVFPVLSLKAFAFVSANYKSAKKRRSEGWAYTFGIWVSFMLIVGLLQFLRAGGSAIGWGFQLQEPLFIAFMVAVMVVVALSLAGMFNISFGVEGAGQKLAEREGLQGAFFKGVLAALVATPCTAPLMAPAIGFALTQPLLVVATIFSLLAFGLALPFLVLSYSSKVAAMMPRPGPWMETVKQALAFPMLLTAAWLLYVFDLQAGPTATLMLLVALVLLVFSIWIGSRFTMWLAKPLAAILALSVIILFVVNRPAARPETPTAASVAEDSFSQSRLAELRAEDVPVFVYFTAEWCITCKVNEQVALFREETQAAFQQKNITVLKGDWTNRNSEIAEVLASYGRAGVPLYLYFPKGAKEAIILPEVLTVGTILDVL